ncbi:molybdenum cofactor biosynthesis protein A [Methanosalsum zhilinae DSM 4017]|uniref:Probable GTP 3',8-cyclase n=1 Tax=Methanosalsum zhilinae (strain DSM 4017 / NBRC 107636 / OCM 62 / WeN5) TaxID=679901 RepID=F7XPY7_METZD|nr:GTP 3',8-cyclase MoaA [Methanosalsum zhilinae]AEH61510.1 molybdenum cofactor biosynthesis protein A [Methanosalsum zhilinae DSM 4017]
MNDSVTANPLTDPFGRSISSLRISVTDRCNLNCIYCHHEGNDCVHAESEISKQTILNLVGAARCHGVNKLKFSGGEPLMRSDFEEIISELPRMKNISATTNGVMLADRAHDLKDSGLDRVNISLDTLDPERYRYITNGSSHLLERVMDGIHMAVDAGLVPVKLNMVLLKGLNDSEIEDMLDFVRGYSDGVVLQLIELMDFNGIPSYRIDADAIEQYLASRAKSIITRKMHRRKKYLIDGAAVEFVRPIDNSQFCAACNRLRVTPQGKLKPCLLVNDNLVDIEGADCRQMHELLRTAVSRRVPFCR